MFIPDGACARRFGRFCSTFRWTPGLGTAGRDGRGPGPATAPPPPAASERKICNLCHRAAELLASIGELPPPSVSVGGGDTLGMVPG